MINRGIAAFFEQSRKQGALIEIVAALFEEAKRCSLGQTVIRYMLDFIAHVIVDRHRIMLQTSRQSSDFIGDRITCRQYRHSGTLSGNCARRFQCLRRVDIILTGEKYPTGLGAQSASKKY